MTEPAEVLVLNALMSRLSTPALSGSPPIASPLVNYSPTPGTSYLDARPILRAEPQSDAITGGSVIRRGIFQVDAVVPDNKGEAIGIRLAVLVGARFAKGTKLAAGTRYVKLTHEPTIAAAVKDAPWVRFPVSIPFELVN
jgi:hypothetical protein